MQRFFDIVFSIIGLVFGAPLFLFLWIAGFCVDGAPLFRQTRVGWRQQPFVLVKFRTMKRGTVSVASHLVDGASITRWGRFLRRTKLDELPQLWNVLKGEMSLVGPRPCLFSQEEVIHARAQRGVFAVRPGITGLAQTKGIDMSVPALLAETDAAMLADFRLTDYFRYIFLTIAGHGQGDCAPPRSGYPQTVFALDKTRRIAVAVERTERRDEFSRVVPMPVQLRRSNPNPRARVKRRVCGASGHHRAGADKRD